mmetsp:Transcript_45990/g.85632  ORF Transcript_45990/g.85632 Transcript_45990/m.85632 type:complete len:109 (-) Transcript_45990:32-358(-)
MPPAAHPVNADAMVIVAGVNISGHHPPEVYLKLGNGQRGGDKKERQPRTCRRCVQFAPELQQEQARNCPGGTPRGNCEHFEVNGQAKAAVTAGKKKRQRVRKKAATAP